MRRILLIVLKAAVSIGLLYIALARTDFSAVGERLNRLNIAWALLAFATLGAQIILGSIRWTMIAKICGAELQVPRALQFNMIGLFFNQVLPSTIGGDAVRIWLYSRDGAGWAKATYSVLLDRFAGVLALALLVVVCLPWSLQLIENPIGRSVLLLVGCGSIAAALAFMVLGGRHWAWMQTFWATRQIAQLAATALRVFSTADKVVKLLGLSLIVQVLGAATAWSVARAVAAPFGFEQALLLLPPVALIATIPISIAGWGVRESALMLAFGYAGLSPNDGLLVSILLGVVGFAAGIIGGGVWLFSGRGVSLSALQQEHPPAA